MEVTVEHVSGQQFKAVTRGHRVVSDQPRENGGTDAGMTPPELLLASLGACAGYYAAEYLRVRSLPLERLTIHVSADKALQPPRLALFRIEVEAPGATDEKSRDGVLRAVKKCLIHNTMLNTPAFEIAVKAPEPALV
jgi:uncharacterized OsmC-like protein